MLKTIKILAVTVTLLWFSMSSAETYVVSTGTHKNILLELYTSEGCSSCPPAEKWLTDISAQRPYTEPELIPLAFHVDYWDYLGWQDPFAKPQYAMRQKTHQVQGAISALYTPQLILNASELRPTHRLPAMFKKARNSPTVLELTLRLDTNNDINGAHYVWQVQLASTPIKTIIADKQSLYFAVTENNLKSVVKAGENSGRSLSHDHVVRSLIGPINLSLAKDTVVDQAISLAPTWIKENLNLVAFVQSPRGDILQAISLRPSKLNVAD